MAASLVVLNLFPAASNIHQQSSRSSGKCTSLKPCSSYTNKGTGAGAQGETTAANGGNGVNGVGNNPVASGVYGVDNAGGYGVSGSTQGASGIGAGLFGLSGNANPALILQVNTTGSGAQVFRANNSTGQIALLDDSGNLHLSGLLYTAGKCANGCTATRHVATYAPREAEATMEDVGEARLVAGRAFVQLDRAFANAIDRSARYAVLITPEGDSRGLFVAIRTATGFEVRENQHGASSLAFFYRVVARPYGLAPARLPFVDDRPGGPQPTFHR
jgi:hypothetical protein